MSNYNLRHRKGNDFTLPIQIQLSDTQFMSQMLQDSQPPPGQGQVAHSSGSDADSEGDLPNLSGTDGSTPDKDQTKQAQGTNVGASTSATINQDTINQAILQQLQAIGTRLEKLENPKQCKKTSDTAKVKKSVKTKTKQNIPDTEHGSRFTATGTSDTLSDQIHTLPTLNVLRANSDVQKQIEARLRELSDKTQGMDKIKSLRGGEGDVFVRHRVKWPQEFVLSGTKKERVSYDSLSMGQWVVGHCRAIQEESDIAQRECMLDYMIALLEDANDFSWQAAKASHAVLLCRMEQGDISDYSQVDKIDRIRRVHAQRHVGSSNQAQNQPKKQNARIMTCSYYNSGSCNYQGTHENKGVSYRHSCAACFRKTGKFFNHPESDCRKSKQSKNE